MELPQDVQEQLQNYEGTIGRLEGLLQPLLQADAKELDAHLEPLQRAQVHLALAQAAHALMQLYLRAIGVDASQHAVAKEAVRLQQYAKKVRKASAAAELAASRRSLAVDVAAANRFIDHAIPDLSAEQRGALKQVSQRAHDVRAVQQAGGAVAAAAAMPNEQARHTVTGGAGGGTGTGTGKREVDPTGASRTAAEAFIEETLAGLAGSAAAGGGGVAGGSATLAGGGKGGEGRPKKKRKSG